METELVKLEDLPPVIEAWGRKYKKGAVIWTEEAETFEIVVTWTTGDVNEGASDDAEEV